MFPKPSSAFVGIPSLVASSSGSAKKARYARLLPSTRNSSASRAGPSSSSSSAPVIVFGAMGRVYAGSPSRTRQRALWSGRWRASKSIRTPPSTSTTPPRLLAGRHAAHRAVEPSLPAAYEQVAVAREAVAALSTAEASGAVATRGGAVVGFMLGTPRADDTWGPNVWVEPAGHASRRRRSSATSTRSPRPLGRGGPDVALRGRAGDRCRARRRLVPARLRAAARPRDPGGAGGAADPAAAGVEIRRPTRDDIDALAELELALPAHQQLSPVFSPLAPPSLEETRAEWEEDFDDPAYATFVAVVDGRVVGSAVGCSVTMSGMHTGIAQPDDAGFLGFAAVLEDARGSGIGRALGTTILDWAAAEGYGAIVTDWRATNLLSSRTWPRLGWRPTFFRLFRAIA